VRYGHAVIEPVPIDLHHNGRPEEVGSFVVSTDDGLALFDCGPATCLPILERGLRERGVTLGDIRHLLLSHIHLDHAGAAGAIARDHPHVTVHVSAIGAPHLLDPSRLEASARRLYGDVFDRLWGALTPVPEANLRVVGDEVVGLACFPTPGHASHHVSYLHRDGTLYSGDVAGVRFPGSTFVAPPLPPPEVDLEAWHASLDEIERRDPQRLACVHFGTFDDVTGHLGRLRATLDRWAGWSAADPDEDAFARLVRDDIAASDPELVERHLVFGPPDHAYQGLARYWRKRREREALG
jgi:glyoxylase-like metal-dependent hydrolase (beta-lactamase superfamily II)